LIKIHALSCILILTALLLPTSFVGLKSALADSMIRNNDVGNSQNHSAFNLGNSGIHLTNFFSNTISAIEPPSNKVVNTKGIGDSPVGIIASSPRNNELQKVNPSSEPVSIIDTCFDKKVHTLIFYIDCAPFTSVFNPISNNNNNILMHLSDAFPNTVFIVAGLGNKVVNTIILGN
jgi:DNA-binding beta-propeller fold protein YncE